MKGTIVTTPASNCLGTMTDKNGKTVDYSAGYITDINKGDVFEYVAVAQVVGGKDKTINILHKRLPK